MAHAASDHIRDGLEASMRVIRKPADVILRVVGTERVEHQERIEPLLQILRKYARELHTGAVRRRLAGNHPLYWTRAYYGRRRTIDECRRCHCKLHMGSSSGRACTGTGWRR